LSAFGRVQGALSTLDSALAKLQSTTTFNATKATASGDGLAVTSSASASPGRYSLVVTGLASGQTSASSAFADSSAAIGSGTITIKDAQGNVASAIQIGGSGEPQTVAALRDAINAADAGVRASLVNDSSGTRLVLTSSDTGIANAFSVETSGAPAAELASMTAAPAQAAADATFTVNGLALTSASNKLTSTVEGLTIELRKEQPTTPIDIVVDRDADAVKAALESFVKAYNDAEKLYDDLSKYDPNTRTGAILNGDSALRRMHSQLKSLLTASRTATAGEFTRLSQVGLELQADGSLKLDEDKFRVAAAADMAKVSRLFSSTAATADEQGLGVRLHLAVTAFIDPEGTLGARQESLRASIRRLDTEQERWSARLASIEKRLRDQYSRLDALLAGNQAQSTALANALAGLQSGR
jgi:flagellar hook-associated protein 2